MGNISKAGRPSKLTDEKIKLAIQLRERNFSIAEIAQALNIDESLLYIKNSDWEKLRQRLNIIKEKQELQRLEKVERSLYERAIGYKVKEKREQFDENGNILGTVINTRHIPADVKAQTLYLTNKDPENWKTQPTESDGDENKKDTNIKIEIVGD